MKILTQTLKAIADPNRIRILKMLQQREMCVCELTGALGVTQPSVSRHLRILEEAEFVRSRRDGLWIYYRLDPESENLYVRALLGHFRDWLEEDQGIRALLQEALALDREVICRRAPSPGGDRRTKESGSDGK